MVKLAPLNMVVFIFNINSSIKLALTGVWEGRKVKKGTLSLGDRQGAPLFSLS